MSDDFNTKGRLLEAMRAEASQGKIPKQVHIPRMFEVEMCLLNSEHVGADLARAILRDGPRKAIQAQGNTLFGMAVVWDADEFKVDAE
jgi:hypothetical protein